MRTTTSIRPEYMPSFYHDRVTAGVAALIVEYFKKGYYPLGRRSSSRGFQPMGALIKAILINSGQQMTGPQANKHGYTYPNMDQVSPAVARARGTLRGKKGESSSLMLSKCETCLDVAGIWPCKLQSYHILGGSHHPIPLCGW